MTKETIEEIKDAMAESLLPSQMEKLATVLNKFAVKPNENENSPSKTKNSDYMKRFLSAKKMEGCSERTVGFYKFVITKYISSIETDIRLASTDDIRSYLSYYQSLKNCSGLSLDNIRRVLSSFFKWLEKENFIIKSPMNRIHRIKTAQTVKEPLADEDIEAIRSECAGSVRNAAIIDLLISSGIRVGELVRLNKKSVKLAERSFVVLGKGNKEREAYFDVRTKIEIENYLNTRKDKNPDLFVTGRKYRKQGYKRLSINAVESLVRGLGKRSAVSDVHPHRFRRTMATRAIDKGMPIEQVQVLLGHTKIDTTLRYANVQQSNVRFSHQKFIC